MTVALRASALNWHDVLVRQGRYGSPLPHIIGADGAGVRTDTGEHVVVLPSLNWGDRDDAPGSRWEILGDHTPGTYAELVSVPADCVAPKPAGLSWAEAAALPLVGRDDLPGPLRPRTTRVRVSRCWWSAPAAESPPWRSPSRSPPERPSR